MIYEIRTSVINGRLKRNSNLIADALNSFEGKEIIIKIEKAKKKRSNPQNRHYWGVAIVLLQNALKESGYIMSGNDVHELLKLRFLKETILVNEKSGEFIERIKSTQELTTTQFLEYILEIQQFSIEYFNVNIPNPNEDLTLQLND